MSTRVGRLRFAYELWSQYGTANLTYRALHEGLRRSGWLRSRFPAVRWVDRPPETYCSPGVPIGLAAYRVFRERSPARFFFKPGSLPVLPRDWAEEAVARGDEILAGRPRLAGHRTAELGFPFDWFVNSPTPVRTDNHVHWCELDGFRPDLGDIRLLWEPGRFGWAFSLARAYAAAPSGPYAAAFWTLLESWRAASPPNIGPHWQDGQECALRLLALCFAFHAFWGDPSSTPERIGMLAQTVALHAERIEGNLGFARTQMGNHAVSEAAALYTTGALFPEFVRAPVWRRKGLRVLDEEARLHNAVDGSYVQHSMNYHRLMLQDYLWVLRLAELNGDRLAPETAEKIDRATRFLYLLQDDRTGRVPNYGPNDGSLVLPLNGCDFSDYRPVIGAVHFQIHRQRVYEAGPWDEDVLWLFGPAAGGPRALPPRECARFDHGGYYTLRGRETWGMVRCHTFRTRPNQADLLHLDLWWRGLNVLRDSGSYLYNAPGPWRDWFTSTAAHNTVQVAGQDQMIKVRRFSWAYLAPAAVRAVRCGGPDGFDYFEGEHGGYRRLPGRVTHRRAVARIGEESWLVVDDLLGRGRESIRVFWHIIDSPWTAQSNRVIVETVEGQVELTFLTRTSGAALRVARGEEGEPPMGWESRRYGERTPAPAACLELASAPLPQRVISLITLGRAVAAQFGPSDDVLRWSDGSGRPVEVRLGPLGQDDSSIVREIRAHNRRWLPE